jgi:NADH-quinone oxidoreductase subunit N
MNVGAFVLIAHLAGNGELSTQIEDYTGLAYVRPGTAACLTVLLLSLAGIPTTAGFFGKFFLFRAAIHSHLIGLTIIALLNSVVSVYYYLKVVVAMYMREGTTKASSTALPMALRTAMAVSLVGIFYLGLFPNLLLTFSNTAGIPLP